MEKMSTEENKWTKLVNRLIELTQKNELSWKYSINESAKEKPSDTINASYFCEYKEKIIRITSYSTIDFYGSYITTLRKREDDQKWITRIKIEIGNHSEGWWEIPSTNNLNDLLDTIKFKTSGAQSVINDLLSEA